MRIVNVYASAGCTNIDSPAGRASSFQSQHRLARTAGESITHIHALRHQITAGGFSSSFHIANYPCYFITCIHCVPEKK